MTDGEHRTRPLLSPPLRSLQARLVATFDECLEHPVRTGVRQAFVSGASQGFTQLVMFSGYSLAFFVGGQFLKSGILTFAQLMRVFLALTMAAQGAGQVRLGGGGGAAAAVTYVLRLPCSRHRPSLGAPIGSRPSERRAQVRRAATHCQRAVPATTPRPTPPRSLPPH